MFSEEELLPLSGLQHYTFCRRRWALVQIERIWEENVFTAEGKLLHERAHSGEVESRPGVLIRRTLPIRSFRLGLSGQADIVEFHPVRGEDPGVRVEGKGGLWLPYPVEYKRRRGVGGSSAYEVQLCGQALCLEEMMGVEVGEGVGEGAIYDGTARRRQTVRFTKQLRAKVEEAAGEMHEMLRAGRTPAPVLKKGCANCSLIEQCMPGTISRGRVAEYLRSGLEADGEGDRA